MASRFAPSPSILNYMASSPNYGKLGSTGAMENLKTAAQNLASNAGIHSAGMHGNDLVEGAEYDAVGIRAEGAARGHQLAMGGLQSGLQGLTGGIMGKYGGGGSSYGGIGTGTIDKASVANSIASVNGREASAILSSGNSFPSFLDASSMPSFSGPSFF